MKIVSKRLRIVVAAIALILPALAGTAEGAAPFELTLNGPATFYPGQALSSAFTGKLSVAGTGIPNQTVEIAVDGQPLATAATTTQGSFAFSLQPFSGTLDRTVKVTAFAGTPLETSTQRVVEVVRFLLDLRIQGSGAGTVTSSAPGISCPPACSVTLPATTDIELSAVASPGSVFVGWGGTGPCGGPPVLICRFSLGSDTNLAPAFSLSTYTLSVTRTGPGNGVVTSNPSGINCPMPCSADFPQGTVVTLTATASSGSIFSGWSGGCMGTGACMVTMNAAKSVTATFALATFTLTIFKSGSGASSGTVTSSPFGINCGSSCTAVFTAGTVVGLTASASLPHSFNSWSGACFGGGFCTVTMNSNQTVIANF